MTILLARPETPARGIRLAVKDLFDTAGLETTYGSAIFAGHVPHRTATAVRLLEEAGYANVGKANLHEFAYGTTSENPHFGDVPNPRFAGRVDPDPRCLLRRRRPQADPRARPPRRLLAARRELRHRWPDRGRCGDMRTDAAGARPGLRARRA